MANRRFLNLTAKPSLCNQLIQSRKISKLSSLFARKTFTNQSQAHETLTSEDFELINNDDSFVSQKICHKLNQGDTGRLFAVVHIGGHQRKVTSEDIIILQKHLEADIGDRICINKVLLVGSKDFTLVGRPVLSNTLVRVEATVLEKTLSHTKISSWYHRRKDHRKFYANKYPFTMLLINNIEIFTPL